MNSLAIRAATAALALLTAGGQLHAQQRDLDQIPLNVVPVADGLYMLKGAGGNIGVSVGQDGVLLIDDQFPQTVGKVRDAVATISDRQIRLVLNTHWHSDHTGGNELLGESGALIIAHENVRKRMSVEHFSEFFNSTTPASPPIALPVVTFTRDVTLHLNGQTIMVEHVPPAHTDGDSLVWFKELNAVHMGDTYFNGFYPFIDASSGGSILGMIGAVDLVLARIDDKTQVIPGHGPLSNLSELRAFRDMLRTVADRVEVQMAKGASVEEIVASRPTAEFDGRWGNGFIKPDDWVRLVCQGLAPR